MNNFIPRHAETIIETTIHKTGRSTETAAKTVKGQRFQDRAVCLKEISDDGFELTFHDYTCLLEQRRQEVQEKTTVKQKTTGKTHKKISLFAVLQVFNNFFLCFVRFSCLSHLRITDTFVPT